MKKNEFAQHLTKNNLELLRGELKVLQINVGKKCNLACSHCHVEAGPMREEMMDQKTAERLVELLAKSKCIETVDLTGGAPELNAHFRTLVRSAVALRKEVIVRCNITVLFEDGQEDTAQFFKENKVRVVASLPCYSKKNVEEQRGRGVFDKSVEGLKILHDLGYGVPGTGLILDLVYNPNGAFLPPDQTKLELDYKKELKKLFNLEFNHLFTITNMPIKRFKDSLIRQNKLESYMDLLKNNFNAKALDAVMCKNLISVSFDGQLYDCDFNQMLEFNVISPKAGKGLTIWDIGTFDNLLRDNQIKTQDHCFACVAGAGSSCTGAMG